MLTITLTALTIYLAAATIAFARPTVEQQIRRAFRDDPDRAVCVARRESTLNPRATFAGNYGLFQINWSSHSYLDRGRLLIAGYNIAAARRIYLDARRRWGNGWLPWSTRGACGA